MEALKASLAARTGRKASAKDEAPAKVERKPATRADATRGEARPKLRVVGNGKKSAKG